MVDSYTIFLDSFIFWGKLRKLPLLSLEEICFYNEKYRLYLLIYYGYYNYIKINNMKINNDVYLFAACFGNVKIMKYLEKCGVNIYYKNQLGQNAYLCAVVYNIKSMKYLEKHELLVYSINYYGSHPYVMALITEKYNLLRHFEKKNLHLYIHKNIKVYYNTLKLDGKKICRYKFNIGKFSSFLFILFIFGKKKRIEN